MENIKLYTIIFIVINFIYISKCFDKPTISLSGVVYDNYPPFNPDFEINPFSNGVFQGLVKSTLGADNKPEYCCGDTTTFWAGNVEIHNQNTFSSWFNEVPGVSIAIPKQITLTLSPDQSFYSYASDLFFPIDGEGWDDLSVYPNTIIYDDGGHPAVSHNFHFCFEFHTTFTYHGGEVLTFVGDDDVWVYINKELAIDLGGIHGAAGISVNLDTKHLTLDQTYPFDYFSCDRHRTGSTISIVTTIELDCNLFDACGVCQGNNDTCCLAENACDQDPIYPPICFTNYCDSDNKTCQHIYNTCDDQNACTIDSCLSTAGGCIHDPILCDDHDPCTIDSCNPVTGCVFNDIPHCPRFTRPPSSPTPTPSQTEPNHGTDCDIYDEKEDGRCLVCSDLDCNIVGLKCALVDNPSDEGCPKIPTCIPELI